MQLNGNSTFHSLQREAHSFVLSCSANDLEAAACLSDSPSQMRVSDVTSDSDDGGQHLVAARPQTSVARVLCRET